jgi:tRNA 2-thiouridine synthesizing protein A
MQEETIEATSTLDTSGKCCPMPMVETNKTMKSLSAGEILHIIATDPGTQLDIPSWCKRTGNELLSASVEDKAFTYYVKKSS